MATKKPAPSLEETFKKYSKLVDQFWSTTSGDLSEKIECRIADLIDSYYGENTLGDSFRTAENEQRFHQECREAGLVRDPKQFHSRELEAQKQIDEIRLKYSETSADDESER